MSGWTGIQGAAGGAAAGTAIAPGWGTAIGAGLGALGGLFGDSTPTPPPPPPQDPQLLAQQQAYLAQLQQRAASAGMPGHSLAELQGQQALAAGRAQLSSQALSDRRNPALAQRTAMLQGGQLAARIQGQTMQGQLAERQQAEMNFANAVNAARQQDLQRQQILGGMNQYAQPSQWSQTMGVLGQVAPAFGHAWAAGQQTPDQQQQQAWQQHLNSVVPQNPTYTVPQLQTGGQYNFGGQFNPPSMDPNDPWGVNRGR